MKTVLIVEDDALVRRDLSESLRHAGFSPLGVGTIAAGRAALISETLVLSAVVLDVRLPDGDGVDLLVAVRDDSVLHDLPVVVLSTEAEIEDRLRGLRSGANDYFGKPYHTDLLVTRIAQLVDEHRRMRAQITLSELDARVARAEAEAATQRATVAEERAQLAEQLARTNLELAQTNRELEAFGYSVSHDLRAPLRAIREFTQALVEDAGAGLDPRAKDHARRVLAATARMSQLIDALLELSRVHRAPITRHRVDMTAISEVIGDELARRDPDRCVSLVVAPELVVRADARLVRLLLDNLLGNAWKFTARTADAKISVGVDRNASTPIYWVRDNGAGFDLAHADRMFTPFHRLHSDTEFSGTGIGLATVRRIVERHGGRIWAEGVVGAGASFNFTLPDETSSVVS